MHFWGYSNDGQNESSTCFVTYKDQTTDELANFKKFLRLNECKIEGGNQQWSVNNGKEILSLIELARQTSELAEYPIIIKTP